MERRTVLHVAPPPVVTKDAIDRMIAVADEAPTVAEAEIASESAG